MDQVANKLLLSSFVVSLSYAFRISFNNRRTAKNAKSFAKRRKVFATLCASSAAFAVKKDDKR